ncbi:MAG: hypothetical protein R2731_14830 [Nocardioides sp.]
MAGPARRPRGLTGSARGLPSPPWRLQGQAWLSLFRGALPGESRATFLLGFARYDDFGTLGFSQLLVARMAPGRVPRLSVLEGWTDSPEAAEGVGALWGLPHEPGVLTHDQGGLGLVDRSAWSVTADGAELVSASFADATGVAPRIPFRAATTQRHEDGTDATGDVTGSARSLPCLAHWDFAAEGPLGWLAGQQPFLSLRARDVRMTVA